MTIYLHTVDQPDIEMRCQHLVLPSFVSTYCLDCSEITRTCGQGESPLVE